MKYILLLICSIFFVSCTINKNKVIRKSIIKLDKNKTNIRDLIDIDGYYTSDSTNMKHGGSIFFEDGSTASFGIKEDLTQNDLQTNLDKSIQKDKSGKWGIFWGVYTIQNDTIIIYSYDEPERLAPWGLSEIRYKVINRQTIKQIFHKIRIADKEYEKGLYSPWRDDSDPLHFIPADSLPTSDNWLKKKKWIWRNESDWEEYMQHVKKEKELRKK